MNKIPKKVRVIRKKLPLDQMFGSQKFEQGEDPRAAGERNFAVSCRPLVFEYQERVGEEVRRCEDLALLDLLHGILSKSKPTGERRAET